MKRLLIHVVSGVLLLCSARAEESARAVFDLGVKAFNESNYPAANEAFLEAADAAPDDKLDAAIAHYDAALAAQAAGDFTAAADLFARAATSADLNLQAKAYYNRGNALFQPVSPLPTDPASTTPVPAMALDAAGDSIGEAIQMYENAIALNPSDVDAKANYELAVLKQQEIQQQQQQQQKQDQEEKSDEKQDEQSDDQQQQQEEENQSQPKPEEDPQEEEQEQPPEPSQDQQEQDSESEQPQPSEPSEEMTEEEAEMMLDAMKAQEQSQRDQLHPFLGRPVPVEKDW